MKIKNKAIDTNNILLQTIEALMTALTEDCVAIIASASKTDVLYFKQKIYFR